MNVVIWARVSSREQREGYSIDAQLRADREKAQKAGWHVVREFVVAESAKRGAERVAFNEMFSWVKANAKREKIKAILSHKLDRVCRNMRDAVRLQELEDACGVQLTFVENQFGPGAAGALSFNVMAAVAQYYSDNLRSEVLKGLDEKVRQGWPTGWLRLATSTPMIEKYPSALIRSGRQRSSEFSICMPAAVIPSRLSVICCTKKATHFGRARNDSIDRPSPTS